MKIFTSLRFFTL